LTGRIFIKLIMGVLLVLVVALFAVDILASRVAERTYVNTLTSELASKARVLAYQGRPVEKLDHAAVVELSRAAAGRITVIDHTGRVIVDSEAEPGHMENHASRPEMRAALSEKVGSDSRTSSTLGVRMLYVAIPNPPGALRIAVPLSEVDDQVGAIRRQLLAAVVLAFLPAVLVAALFARGVSAKLAKIIAFASKLARGECQARLNVTTHDELGVLSAQLNETGEKLQKMFEELEKEHAQLEALERVRKDFVINVSHELRTPLASIQGYTETLLEGALDDAENNVRFLTIIRQNAERLGRLTADLMTLSRIELKTTKFQFASYYVNALIEDCLDSLRPIAAKKRASINYVPAEEDTEVFCDTEAVHQIVMNLVDNAIKYTSVEGVITVGARPLPQDQNMIEIYVQDTGPGIPPEDLPRLFERFYRVDKARSRDLGGTGLGLAIVKHLVRAQGGNVFVKSEVSNGSVFSFTLPVHDLGLTEDGAVQAELTVP
jgi:two-component system phosphate regulon sensor histidine kinase PhoR